MEKKLIANGPMQRLLLILGYNLCLIHGGAWKSYSIKSIFHEQCYQNYVPKT